MQIDVTIILFWCISIHVDKTRDKTPLNVPIFCVWLCIWHVSVPLTPFIIRFLQLVVGEVIRSGSDVIPLEDESQRGHAADTCFYAAIFYICKYNLLRSSTQSVLLWWNVCIRMLSSAVGRHLVLSVCLCWMLVRCMFHFQQYSHVDVDILCALYMCLCYTVMLYTPSLLRCITLQCTDLFYLHP